MIHYALICSLEHEFDGWFSSSMAFEAQAARDLVECPVCGDINVRRALMAPSLPRKSNARDPAKAPQPDVPQPSAPPATLQQPSPGHTVAVAGDRLPAHVRVALQRLRAEVERHCDYVGDQFAEEARRIHHGESERRAIYGETTPDEAEELAADGIEVSSLPWVTHSDS